MSLTAITFALAFFGAMLLALFRHPLYGLYAYVAVFYLHPPDRWWGAELPDLRWSLLAAVVTLAGTLLRPPTRAERPPWTGNAAAWILILLTGWIWIQNLWALSPEEHLEFSILYTKYILLFYLMYRLLEDEKSIREFLLVHVGGCIYLGWLVLQAPEGGRLEGVGGPGIDEANALGMQLAAGGIAAAVLLVRGSLPTRAFALMGGPLILNGIIQTGSRGAFLGMVFGGLALVYLTHRAYRKYWYFFGAVALLALLRFAPDNYWERIRTIADAGRSQPMNEEPVDQAIATRWVLIEKQWEMFLEYPAGTGHRGTAVLSPRYLSHEHLSRSDPDEVGARSSHNTFMTALSEQGFVGGLLYTLLLLWIYRTCRRIREATRDAADAQLNLYMAAAGASLVSVTVSGMFTDYFKAEVFLWGTVLLAALMPLALARQRGRPEELEMDGAVEPARN